MSSSIAIPKRKQNRPGSYGGSSDASSSSSAVSPSSSSSPYSDSMAASPRTPSTSTVPSLVSPSANNAGPTPWQRRPSLLGTSLSKSEYTVINVGGPDGPPRLITCVKASQGFDWNQDIFLPSYMDYDSSELERKPDPVQDIVLTDEEAASFLPQ